MDDHENGFQRSHKWSLLLLIYGICYLTVLSHVYLQQWSQIMQSYLLVSSHCNFHAMLDIIYQIVYFRNYKAYDVCQFASCSCTCIDLYMWTSQLLTSLISPMDIWFFYSWICINNMGSSWLYIIGIASVIANSNLYIGFEFGDVGRGSDMRTGASLWTPLWCVV